jgi:hypothetical protein
MRNAFEARTAVRSFRGVVIFLALLFLTTAAFPQTSAPFSPQTAEVSSQQSQNISSSVTSDPGPLFFGKGFLRGYLDFELAPPHNEPDLGRCNQPQPNCSAFARYIAAGYVEFQPFARTPLRHLYFFYEPRFFFGDNIPQVKYTYSMAPLAYEKTLGLAIALPKHFELRVTNHGVTSFPPFDVNLGPYDSGPDKEPLGIYNTVGVRWYFGGYDHSSSSW